MDDITMTRDTQEETIDTQNAESNQKSSKRVLIVILAAIILMQFLLMVTQMQLSKAQEEKAYVTSVLINLLEDRLLLKYGVLPEEMGLGEVKDAWIDNPCAETADAYCQVLQDLVDYLEQKKPKEEVIFAGIQV